MADAKSLAFQDYAPSSGQYRPKVSTWGVFERPANISKAFGGGRNLRPGGALEDESATAERKRRVASVRSLAHAARCMLELTLWMATT